MIHRNRVIPMRRQILLSVIGALLVAALFAVAGCTAQHPPPPPAPTPPVTLPPVSLPAATPSAACGFTSCHGLDLACTASPPQVCTQEYQVGDKCRKYARCDAGCSLVTDPQFASCKACAQQCEIKAAGDPIAATNCEEQCL